MDVLPAVAEHEPALVVLDLQIGNMGGMATCMALHLEAGAGRLPRVPVLMLLDRDADVFLARRSDADGWMIKPIDAFRLRKAATALLEGGTYHEGVPDDAAPLLTWRATAIRLRGRSIGPIQSPGSTGSGAVW